MHKKFLLAAAALLGLSTISHAAPVKSEMRSAWLATVWQLDWPPSVTTPRVTTDAQLEQQINRQKAAMDKMLDSIAINNFNAVNFQIRSRCDAMYQSSYEPWSSDLTLYRGDDPGWDPLAYVVEECHKRGLECHAWLNPYRNESSVTNGSFNGAKDYRTLHPDWLLTAPTDATYSDYSTFLNPALPEVRQRICDIITEVITNYDVDGVLFDDYFYVARTPTDETGDGAQYAEYTAAGGTLSQSDWRRENVNQMIHDVYTTIKSQKPWIRFGVSPAGVACTSSSVANKYGISPCPSGSDWQYNDIFSDPINWIYNQNLDFISPQVYWTIGHSTDYSKVTPWWYDVVEQFGRHCYISHSITSLTAQSKVGGASMKEIDIKATGQNGNTFKEYADQINILRESDNQGAPGSIFFSAKYISNVAPLFGHYLKNNVYTTPALLPAMTWETSTDPGKVQNLAIDADYHLTWDAKENVRYTVYAVPNSLAGSFTREPQYLLGITYGTSWDVPEAYQAGYQYGVAVYDRYGYEWDCAIVAPALSSSVAAPALTAPANGASLEAPFDFTWSAVSGASLYLFEVSPTADFTTLSSFIRCEGTTLSTLDIADLTLNETAYWRVRACAKGKNDGVSETRSFVAKRLDIASPSNNAAEVSLTPTITWTIPERDVTVEISKSDDFTDLIYSAEAKGGSHQIPTGILAGYTDYYVRLVYLNGDETVNTSTVMFTTETVVPGAMSIVYPENGGEFYADDYIEAAVVPGPYQLTFQLDQKESIGSRFVQETVAVPTWHSRNTFDSMSQTLTPGNVYYMRVRGSYRNGSSSTNTDWSTVISATYKGERAGVGSVAADSERVYLVGKTLHIAADGPVTATLVSMSGATLGTVFQGTVNGSATASIDAPHGIYLLVVTTPTSTRTLKASL